MKRFDARITFLLLLLFSTQGHSGDSPLTVGTWGGPYEAAQKVVLFTPFELNTEFKIIPVPYFGGLELLKAPTNPDVLDMLEEEALIACDQGLILKLDADQLINKQLNLLRYDQDFLNDAISECGIAHLTFSTVVAFDERAYPGAKPQTIADLFDVIQFPGKRAFKKEPSSLLEWALMAEGVPNSQIYHLLSTERGMRIALRRLNTIREHIIWWDKPAEAVTLLKEGKAAMVSGYNGRFFDAWRSGTPISMLWDGQLIDRSVWVIPANEHNNTRAAQQFIQFALSPERQAKIAERIPYGPTRNSAFKFIGLHPEAGISMADHLPTAPHHLQRALIRDTQWYARTSEFRRRHFNQWLK